MSDYNVLLHTNELLQGENRILKADLAKCREEKEELQSAQDIIEYVLLHGETHSEVGQMLEEMVAEHKAKADERSDG